MLIIKELLQFTYYKEKFMSYFVNELSVFYALFKVVKYRFFFFQNKLIRGPPSFNQRKNDWRIFYLMNRPKRRKKKDNPYILEYMANKNIYIVSFKDVKSNIQRIEVNKEIYDTFNQFELDDLKELNEYDNHIEHSEVFENSLYKRVKDKTLSLEDSIMQKSTFKELKEAIDKLPEIQKRRIKKYYFEDKNEYQIAAEEDTTQQAVNKTLHHALEKLKKILKN